MGIDNRIGVSAAIPNNPNLDLTLTHLLLFFVNIFLGFFLLNNPVFLLNQFHSFKIPELRYMNTMIPKVPDDIPKIKDSVKVYSCLITKNGTVMANLKDAIKAYMIVSNQSVFII